MSMVWNLYVKIVSNQCATYKFGGVFANKCANRPVSKALARLLAKTPPNLYVAHWLETILTYKFHTIDMPGIHMALHTLPQYKALQSHKAYELSLSVWCLSVCLSAVCHRSVGQSVSLCLSVSQSVIGQSVSTQSGPS